MPTADLDGIAVHYEIDGSGPPLVLTHGLGSAATFWEPLVEPLAAHHRVLRWDLRGAGRSGTPPGPYSPALFARDLAALLDRLDIGTAHLVGHSGGGVVSQRFALDFPSRVRSLVLVSTSSEVGAKAAQAWHRLADAVERNGFGTAGGAEARAFGPAFAAAHPELVAEIGRRTRANDPVAYAATARAFGSYGWTAELSRIQLPVLILQGLEDALTPPGGSVIMSRHLPRARLLMVPDAGHSLPLEMPTFFTAVVLAFLAGVDLA
ncbi:MAG TPA: alpha/beta fold hydrolase [Candidatus Binatia bacterium]|nr:alpha/beta fold hydrolase [Candidatus Binatia bacterium]